VAAAFAAGRPMIATAVGGLVDFVQDGENGLLVPGHDPDALAEAIRRLMDDPALWRRLADGAARTAREEATWERYAQIVGASWPGPRQPA
jgi:D-inositol-3-phosphate glycosyltransferase